MVKVVPRLCLGLVRRDSPRPDATLSRERHEKVLKRS